MKRTVKMLCCLLVTILVFEVTMQVQPLVSDSKTASADQAKRDFHQQPNHRLQQHQPTPGQQPVQQQNQYASNNQQQQNNQQQNNNRATEQQRPVDALTQLAKHPSCLADVQRLCAQMKDEEGKQRELQHNFEVLDCFNSYKGDEQPPSKPCQTFIYEYKRLLTTDDRFESAAKDVCKDLIVELDGYKECYGPPVKGAFLPCFMELAWGYDDEKGNEKHKNCLNFMNKMQRVIFSDYHLVHPFLESCKNEVRATECGLTFSDRPKKEEDKDSVDHHNQGPALDCLMSTDLSYIGEQCRREMMRVVELQSDDYHLDRPLYFACRGDRERFCANVPSRQGKVYKCLMEHTQDNSLSPDCHKQVIKREQLMLVNAKVDMSFYMTCLPILKKTECYGPRRGKEMGMGAVLRCLLDYEVRNEELHVPVECQKEIELFQSNLMDDYKISPGIAHYCEHDIDTHCSGLRKVNEQDGTVHCLMGLAMPTRNMDERGDKQGQSKLSTECLAQINILVDETRGPAQSVLAIDKFLHEQCAFEFNEFCASSKAPLDCLMLQIQEGKIDQSSNCARHLLELEYFISRNYKRDVKLWKACHKDIKAHNLDHHLRIDENGPESDGLVFAQLYKIVREQIGDGTEQHPEISHPCISEVLRSVHERAVSIDLNPELEEKCLPDLISIFCFYSVHGEELGCLQEHVDKLKSGTVKDPGCKEMVSEWIISQDADYKLNYILMKSCQPPIKKYCEDVVNGVQEGEIDNGEIIKCLIDNKYDEDMDKKCFAGIEHHQLVNMQDFNFNKNFRESCNEDFKTHCEHVKSKSGVVYCLSDLIRNDTLHEQKHRVSRKCRDELRAEFLALEDTINLDPEFADVCGRDLDDHCDHVKPGPGADARELFLDCLRNTDPYELRPKCAKYVFKIAKLQNAVAGASSHVFRDCKPEIKKYCSESIHDPETLLSCLNGNYNDSSIRCHRALNVDEEQNNQDIRLNPALYMSCKDDIHDFCEKEFNKGHDDQILHGAVIECLKLEYVKAARSGLSESCSNQMHLLVVKVQTRDYKQDYVLTHACKDQIKECANKYDNEKHIIKCLREKLMQGDLKDDVPCQSEVFRLITENRVDIHTDAELHEACVADIKDSVCRTVAAGSDRVMSCLLSLYDAGNLKNKDCIERVENRKELWEHFSKLSPPESLGQIWDGMTTSNSSWFIIGVICAVLAVVVAIGIVYRLRRGPKRMDVTNPDIADPAEAKPLLA